jgi:hypothetical protein
MVQADDAVTQLLRALSEAKTWPERLKDALDRGVDVSRGIRKADEEIGQLEKRAKEAMKSLGCVSPHTRAVYHGMADMLINWQTFKDSLG